MLKTSFLFVYRFTDWLLSVGDSTIEKRLSSRFLTQDQYALCRSIGEKEVVALAWRDCDPVQFYQDVRSIALQRIKSVRPTKGRGRPRRRQLHRRKSVVISIEAQSDIKAWSELSAQARAIILRVELFYFIVGALITVKRCLMVWFILDCFRACSVLGRSVQVMQNGSRGSPDSVATVLEDTLVAASNSLMGKRHDTAVSPALSFQERGHSNADDIIDPPRFHHYHCRGLFEEHGGEIVGPDNHSTGFRCQSVV